MPDIASRLASQSLDLDLLISVPSEQAADDVRLRVESAGLRIGALAVVPNRGRDIGPLLTEFGPLLLERYDLVGHIHTKKSVTVEDEVMGQMWFRFLMENLIGGRHPMASQIISRLGADNRLGLVFPDDPNVIGWTQNRPEAGKLASRLGLSNLPENQFNFPVGTMFWARVKAIAPLLELGLSWDDYPEEPLPYDGTMLHALERLFPSIGLTSGFGLALTNVPGITR
jgi:lipopolysaccharide biosynthesis protein